MRKLCRCGSNVLQTGFFYSVIQIVMLDIIGRTHIYLRNQIVQTSRFSHNICLQNNDETNNTVSNVINITDGITVLHIYNTKTVSKQFLRY
jgi:hypothetical protein